MPKLTLTGTYQEVGTGLTFALLQATNVAEVFIGAAPPAASDVGFTVKWNIPQEYDAGKYGGTVYARGDGVLMYATSTS